MVGCVVFPAAAQKKAASVPAKPAPAKPASESQLWILHPVVRPNTPTGVTSSTNPIDAFVADRYKAKGLKAVGAADRGTLLRRVYLDLTGIPPTPEELKNFLNDSAPDAYEKVVDKLLASDQYGVR